MKNLILAMVLVSSGSVFALGESDHKMCECNTCPTGRRVCDATQGEGERTPKDFNSKKPASTNSKAKSGATKG